MPPDFKKILIRALWFYPLALVYMVCASVACFNYGPDEWYEKYLILFMATPITTNFLSFDLSFFYRTNWGLIIVFINPYLWTVIIVSLFFYRKNLQNKIRGIWKRD